MNRSKDWRAQAEFDLETAATTRDEGYHEWACFMAQQAAEKGIKAVAQSNKGAALWGLSISEMLNALKDQYEMPVSNDLLDKSRKLDRYYIIARYPNGFDSGIPHDYFDEEESANAISFAEILIRWCDSL